MNLIATADSLKNLSDAQLRQTYMGGQVPQFLVLTEMQNRQKIRSAYQGQDPSAAKDTTIADKLLAGVGALPTAASIAANTMMSQGQGDPGSPGADAAVPPGGSNPSATGIGAMANMGQASMGPGGGTPMKPPAPGGNAQGFNMGMGGSPKGFAEGGRVGFARGGSDDLVEGDLAEWDRLNTSRPPKPAPVPFFQIQIPGSDGKPSRDVPITLPDIGMGGTPAPGSGSYTPPKASSWVPSWLRGDDPTPVKTFDKSAELPGYTQPPPGQFDQSAELPGYKPPTDQGTTLLSGPGSPTEDRQDRAGFTPQVGGERPRPTSRSVGQGGPGGGGGGGGGGGTSAGGGGSAGVRGIKAYAQDLADMFPDRFGDTDKDVEGQRKALADAKSDNVSNTLIRMGSAMMEGGAKSGNFMGIVGLGLRSGQDEMNLRQAQQEKMRQAITEGGLKTATGRTARDDALARTAGGIYGTDVHAATTLEAARMQADAHLKAAAMHAGAASGASKNQLIQIATAHAQAEGRDGVTSADLDWAMRGLHTGGRSPVTELAHDLAGDGPVTPDHFNRASELLRPEHTAGADAREAASNATLLENISKAAQFEPAYMNLKTEQEKTNFVLNRFRLYQQGLKPPAPIDVRQ